MYTVSYKKVSAEEDGIITITYAHSNPCGLLRLRCSQIIPLFHNVFDTCRRQFLIS